MSKEEDFFKENFPEYVTEKGEFLSPYWDLFRAGVICATFELKEENTGLKEKLDNLASVAEVRLANWQKLDKELKAEKEYSATLRKEIDEYTNSHTLCAKYKELEKAYNETEELLDKQIEATYNVVEENKEAKEIIRNLLRVTYGEGWNYSLDVKVKAEQFLKELEK